MKNNEKGLTLIELVVVMGIVIMLFGVFGFSSFSTAGKVSLNTASETLISDIALQQNKAMQGLGTTSGISYGIYFENDKYTLFKGNVYSPLDTNNYVVNLDSSIDVSSVTFPGGEIIFTPGAGEISGYSSGQNTITLEESNGAKTETITFNKYGVVTNEN